MRWIRHSSLEGTHAFLSASSHSWLNYSDEKLVQSYYSYLAKERGTRLHALAAELINERIKLPENNTTFNMYVNDAIGFKLDTEVLLYFSEYCYGTADSIRYDEKNRFLRIHDLKTGTIPASMDQLLIYSAIFFLEYDIDVKSTDVELRIYQNDDVLISNPSIDEIFPVMDKIISSDKVLQNLRKDYNDE